MNEGEKTSPKSSFIHENRDYTKVCVVYGIGHIGYWNMRIVKPGIKFWYVNDSPQSLKLSSFIDWFDYYHSSINLGVGPVWYDS